MSLVLEPLADDFDHRVDRSGVLVLRDVYVPDVRRGDLVLGTPELGIGDAVALGAVEGDSLERADYFLGDLFALPTIFL